MLRNTLGQNWNFCQKNEIDQNMIFFLQFFAKLRWKCEYGIFGQKLDFYLSAWNETFWDRFPTVSEVFYFHELSNQSDQCENSLGVFAAGVF